MDQYSSKNESAPFKLPEVQQEPTDDVQAYESVAKSTDESAMSKAVEQNSISNPLTSTSSQPITPIHIDPATFQSPSQPLQSDSGIKKIAVTDDLSANDNDLIEKAWVVKAKAIVEETKNDPHEQTNEIKRIRNDYQSKRFKLNLKSDKE